MIKSDLQRKANIIFYQTLGMALGFLALLVFLGIGLYPKLVLIWRSLMHKLETVCGCSSHFSFINHPFAFSFLILSAFGLMTFLSLVVIKVVKLKESTQKYIKTNLKKRKKTISTKLRNAVRLIGAEDRIIEISDESPVIFSFGYVKPMICISSGLVRKLQRKELLAVLQHEKHHLDTYEPIKIFFVKAIAKLLFFLPGIKSLTEQYLVFSEITADQKATNNFQDKGPLARALYKYMKLNERVVLQKNLAISYFSPTTERINKLIDDENIPKFQLFTPKLLISVLVLIFSFFAFNTLLSSEKLTGIKHGVEACEEMKNMPNNQCNTTIEDSACIMNYSLDNDTCEMIN